MRVTLPRAIAVSAVFVLSAACGSMSKDADAERSLVPVTPAALTLETFAPRVLPALLAKGSFSVEAFVVPKGGRDQATFTANVRLTGSATDVSIPAGDPPIIRIGDAVYVRDHKLTGSAKRPWARLNPGSKNPAEEEALFVAETLIGISAGHQVIVGTAYATEFKRGEQTTIDGDETQEYIVTIDSHRAAAAGALGELLNSRITKTAPKGLSVSIAVDAEDVPRRIEFVLDDGADLATRLRLTLRDFGKSLPIAAPPAAMVGNVGR
ncbi:hypothetical protein [Kribbella sp. NPDC050470]|uniref:hypothetical protein n=1 Tax=unclassified Kribbella TaxID=2644121 RepID=UPI00378DDE9B